MLVQVNGLKEVREMLAKLPKRLRDEIGEKGMHELAKNLQRRMKRRVPVSTGWLRRSIMIEKDGKIRKVTVHAIYAEAVEKGSRPHIIPIEYLEQHYSTPEAPGHRIARPRGYIWAGGADSRKPFVTPALNSFRPAIPNILKRFIEKVIKK